MAILGIVNEMVERHAAGQAAGNAGSGANGVPHAEVEIIRGQVIDTDLMAAFSCQRLAASQ